MFVLNSVRLAPGVRSALAVACGLALSALHVAAQAVEVVSPVVVTATRQAVGATELLSDVTVIERAELDQAGASTLASQRCCPGNPVFRLPAMGVQVPFRRCSCAEPTAAT